MISLHEPHTVHRPLGAKIIAMSDSSVDPEGGAQDVRRFSMRQGCLIEKSQLRLSRQFRIGLKVFSLVTFFSKRKSLAHQREKGARRYLET